MEIIETSGRLHPSWPQNKRLYTPWTKDYGHTGQDRWIQTELAFTLATNATTPNPVELIPLQTTRKENNWKTEETLARRVVTVETERTKLVQSLMFIINNIIVVVVPATRFNIQTLLNFVRRTYLSFHTFSRINSDCHFFFYVAVMVWSSHMRRTVFCGVGSRPVARGCSWLQWPTENVDESTGNLQNTKDRRADQPASELVTANRFHLLSVLNHRGWKR